MVTDEFIETRPLARRITDNKFEIGDWKFIKSRYKFTPDTRSCNKKHHICI